VMAVVAPDSSLEDPSVSPGEPPDCDEPSESPSDDTPAGASPPSSRSSADPRPAVSPGAPESRPSDRVSLDFPFVIRLRGPPFQVEFHRAMSETVEFCPVRPSEPGCRIRGGPLDAGEPMVHHRIKRSGPWWVGTPSTVARSAPANGSVWTLHHDPHCVSRFRSLPSGLRYMRSQIFKGRGLSTDTGSCLRFTDVLLDRIHRLSLYLAPACSRHTEHWPSSRSSDARQSDVTKSKSSNSNGNWG